MLARRAAERGGALLNAARARRVFSSLICTTCGRGETRGSIPSGILFAGQRVECEVCVGVGWRCVLALRRGTTDLPRASRRFPLLRTSPGSECTGLRRVK